MPYEYKTVDLGLPSRLLWCEYNLGAFPSNNPKSWYGDYYAYGETETKKVYGQNNWISQKYGENDEIEPSDDTAFEILGDPFRMPTKDDFQELLNNTAYKFVKNYKNIHGLNGVLFKSTENNNTLFFQLLDIMMKIILTILV